MTKMAKIDTLFMTKPAKNPYLLISARPQRQTNAEVCRIFGDLDQLKSKDAIQKTVD